MNVTKLSLVSAFALLATALPAAEKPIALAPQNPHYFVWRGKPTILVTSGEHYGAVLNLDFDYTAYLDTLAADGLNHTRLFAGTYREIPGSFNITDNTLAPAGPRFTCPWARSDRSGNFDGGNRFDLTRWDPAYFGRLRQFMTVAREHGVVVELNLFCPLYDDKLWAASPMNAQNNVNGVGDCPRVEVLALRHPRLTEIQLAVTRKLVGELNAFDNLYFEVCNEPYFGGVTEAWQARIVQEIVDVEKKLPHRHLISMNIANGRKKVEKPLPDVSIFNFHYCVPPDTVALNYSLNRVIGENETGFRGPHDLLYRTEGWDFLLAGGGLYNNLDYSFTAAHSRGTFRDYRSPGGGSPELRKQLGILKRFLDGFDFVRMKPDREVIRSLTDELTATALSEPGKAYAVYLHVPLPVKPKKMEDLLRDDLRARLTLRLPAGQYRAEWIDTLTGATTGQEQFQHAGGAKPLATPTFSKDIALRIMGQQ